jgi:hypothetical protein
MTDRPILFSAPMVRALLEGRKTQTRRIITPHNLRVYTGGLDYSGRYLRPDEAMFEAAFNNARNFRAIEGVFAWVTDPAPHQIGAVMSQWTGRLTYSACDRLWVREAWRCEARLDKRAPRDIDTNYPGVKYIATDVPDDFGIEGKERRAMHMPRWASRLTLIVSDVRVQRLQDISKADAIAEGVERDSDGWRDYLLPHTRLCVSATGSFQTLWNHINGPDAWKANPWIAAYTFNVINSNIDQIEVAA